jgi:putative transcriptional regulator
MEPRLPGGALLAAWPDMLDPNFAKSVLLVCRHSADGAYGLVLNRELGLTVGRLLPEHPVLGHLSSSVWLGGPVDHQRLQFVHMLPGRIRGGLEICTGVWLGGELDALGEVLAKYERGDVAAPPVRLFLGYAGWGAGQLDGELATGSWMPGALDSSFLFGEGGEADWERFLATMGREGDHTLDPDSEN